MTPSCYRMYLQPIFILMLLVSLSGHLSVGLAKTYYVDPTTGNDKNPGTSRTAPWQTLPGTRQKSDQTWLRQAWGDRTSAQKFEPGDTIELKAGRTMQAAIGGRLVIDSTFYHNGTATAPITIRVSADWGNGHFTYNMAGMAVPAYDSMVLIRSRDYVHLRGANEERRFVVTDAPGDWAISVVGNRDRHQRGSRFEYIETRNGKKGGLNISYADHWTVAHAISHDNGQIGFAVGEMDDKHADSGTFQDSTTYRNGLRGDSHGIRHGFGVYGGTNITFLRCISHDNGRDGFDFGTTSNSHDSSTAVINSAAYNNGEDGFATNGGSGKNTTTYLNSIAYNNGQAGWHIYDGVDATLYHTIAHHNGNQRSFGGNFMIYSENLVTTAIIRNSIGYKPKSYANVYSYNSRGLKTHIDSDYNIFVPRSSNSEVMSETPFGTSQTYKSPPTWIGPHDKIGLKYDPDFVHVGTGNFTQNDYHLASPNGAAVNAGTALPHTIAVQDRDGQNRSGNVDIGLYQHNPSAPNLSPPTSLQLLRQK